jgi:large subunit ribosomal protein L18
VNKQREINHRRERRQFRVRKKLRGTAEQPRLAVHRTLKHISCQLIDDVAGRTIVSVSTIDKELREQVKYGGNCAAAAVVGKRIAEKALQAGISRIRFDRGHAKYHGRVASLANAAREAGLQF